MNSQAWTTITPETMAPGISRRAVHADNATVARFDLAEGAVVARHAHENEQITTVVEGALRLDFDDRQVVVKPGELIVIPPNVPHAARALEKTIVVDFFTPRREDWLRKDDAYLRVSQPAR
jgi:quercetin dioxygenase-like cupin family protein